MLEHHTQFRKGGNNRAQVPLDKFLFAVEHIDRMIRHLAVDAQHDILGLHPREHRIELLDIGDTRGRVGGGVGGVHLGRGEHAFSRAARQIVGIGVVGEVAGHQRGEFHARRHRRHDPLTIGRAKLRRGHRRGKVGHHDRAGKLARGVGHHLAHHIAIAEMQVPIVGAADREGVGHGFPLATAMPICHA